MVDGKRYAADIFPNRTFHNSRNFFCVERTIGSTAGPTFPRLYTLIALQQHYPLPEKVLYTTENWLSSTCFISMTVQELIFPSWHQPAADPFSNLYTLKLTILVYTKFAFPQILRLENCEHSVKGLTAWWQDPRTKLIGPASFSELAIFKMHGILDWFSLRLCLLKTCILIGRY